MQALPQSTRAKAKATIALLLTFAAGIVDIVGYITLYHSFVSHMTGNTVHLGSQLVTGNWAQSAKAATVIASFVVGSVIGRAVIETGARRRNRAIATITLLLEAVLILLATWLYPVLPGNPQPPGLGRLCVLLALLAGAMGMQTATLTRIGPLTIHTTFVTGMLNKLAQSLSQWFFWIYDSRGQNASAAQILRSSGQQAAFRNARLMAAIWITYMFGSVAGTWMNSQWKIASLYVPVLILVVSAATDQVQPLSIEEEKEQV